MAFKIYLALVAASFIGLCCKKKFREMYFSMEYEPKNFGHRVAQGIVRFDIAMMVCTILFLCTPLMTLVMTRDKET